MCEVHGRFVDHDTAHHDDAHHHEFVRVTVVVGDEFLQRVDAGVAGDVVDLDVLIDHFGAEDRFLHGACGHVPAAAFFGRDHEADIVQRECPFDGFVVTCGEGRRCESRSRHCE